MGPSVSPRPLGVAAPQSVLSNSNHSSIGKISETCSHRIPDTAMWSREETDILVSERGSVN
ncbi:hypothetical protein EXN66_Car012813 [Channa argus]|uniref:Uncharacterized protein n=1 Tax=Channa argus TaxID=215402 RepID=A0A6G1Q443_CHAAH|nr:hypothetical protein EXN66_Car012813 [Channa argus]